ncbi:MAG: DUF2157 domain-containing protein, partial [Acidobacteriota bacterium]|nr:DUF2157 domain-containing protein [Acidobacteriota bacterium]
ALRSFYGPLESGRRIALIIFGVLGTALIGAGIILLFAHNWNELTRPVRAALSLGLLAVAQALAGWALIRKADSAAWREATAVFQVLAVGSSIALISQTYNIIGELDDFLLVWMVVILPVVYLMDSRAATVLYGCGIALWAITASDSMRPLFWLLAAFAVPYVLQLARKRSPETRDRWVFWVLSGALVAANIALCESLGSMWMLYLSGAAAGMYALSVLVGPESALRWPFAIASTGGIALTGLILTFEEPWGGSPPELTTASVLSMAVAAGLFGLAVWQGIRLARRSRWPNLLVCAAPLFMTLGFALNDNPPNLVAVGLLNLYLFALGLTTLIVGLRRSHLGQANAGLLLLSALFVVRFFDEDLSMVLRGASFIAVGAAFLVMNVRMFGRRRKEVQP